MRSGARIYTETVMLIVLRLNVYLRGQRGRPSHGRAPAPAGWTGGGQLSRKVGRGSHRVTVAASGPPCLDDFYFLFLFLNFSYILQ